MKPKNQNALKPAEDRRTSMIVIPCKATEKQWLAAQAMKGSLARWCREKLLINMPVKIDECKMEGK